MRGTCILAVVLCAAGCSPSSPYHCTADTQCILGGDQGTCDPAGFCSFPDPACESGQRFEPNAGDGLAGTCAPPACGVTGNACCAGGEACRAGGSCVSGTCEPCLADVALGRRFACMLQPGGSVYCSGDNGSGQLGIGLGSAPQADPEQVRDQTSAFVADATAISAGHSHACAIRAGGSVWCWGGGFGDVAQQIHLVDGSPVMGITKLQSGDSFDCALDATGQLLCWGDNTNGQLGDGTVTGRGTAAPVLMAAGGAPFTGIKTFTLGGSHACATTMADELYCWGFNNHGQVGDGSQTNQVVPVKSTLGTTTHVSAGRFHTCAVASDGTVSCWGSGSHNRLGRGTFDGSDALAPIKVAVDDKGTAFTNATQVEVGAVSCAITSDTHVWCWGDNRYGQTGNGATSVVPVEVIDATNGQPLSGAERLIVHFAHACAQLAGGGITCWGRNTEGTFGNGTFLNVGLATGTRATCP